MHELYRAVPGACSPGKTLLKVNLSLFSLARCFVTASLNYVFLSTTLGAQQLLRMFEIHQSNNPESIQLTDALRTFIDSCTVKTVRKVSD